MQNNQILIVQNYDIACPGLLAAILKEKGIGYSIVHLEAGDTLPAASNFAAVVVLGGLDSANDQTDKIKSELIWIRQVIASNTPYLGICLGLQLGVKAMGGAVFKNPIEEAGFKNAEGIFYKAKLTSNGQHDPILKGLKPEFAVFESHDDTVGITDSMLLLAEGIDCVNQIVKIGEKAYGAQFHFELTSEMFTLWFRENPRFSNLNSQALETEYQTIQKEYEAVGRQLFGNFLSIAGL